VNGRRKPFITSNVWFQLRRRYATLLPRQSRGPDRPVKICSRHAHGSCTRGGGRALFVRCELKANVQAFQTFYYTAQLKTTGASLAHFADARGKEPGTLRGSSGALDFPGRTGQRGIFGGILSLRLSGPAAREMVLLISSNAQPATAGTGRVTGEVHTLKRGFATRKEGVLFSSAKRHRHLRQCANRPALSVGWDDGSRIKSCVVGIGITALRAFFRYTAFRTAPAIRRL